MVYLKIPIGNEAHEGTTFIHIHIHGGYSVVNMQYSHAKYKHFFFFLILYILDKEFVLSLHHKLHVSTCINKPNNVHKHNQSIIHSINQSFLHKQQ